MAQTFNLKRKHIMNCHTKLKLHLERHVYKRGKFKGDAPADSSRRGKSYFRVIQGNNGQMIVRMHNADLITAHEDGRIVLNTRGWHDSQTTRACMNEALCFFGMGCLTSQRYRGYSQAGIRMNGKTYRYYDGMEFSAEGTLLTPPKPFTAKITDREETAEFRADIKESGFVDVFPILYAAATVPEQSWYGHVTRKVMTSDVHANSWPQLIAMTKYPGYRYRSRNQPKYDNHKDALKALTASVTKNMTKLVDTDVTVL
jgi:hypothetical protein